MITVLLHSDIFELCFTFNNYQKHKKIFDLVYNSSIIICFTKKYIEYIEQFISNKDIFQALIRELYDTNRIKIENTISKNDLKEEFVQISKECKDPLLIPVVFKDTGNLINEISFLTILNNAKPINKHWIVLELISNNYCNVCYQQFENEIDILKFFENLLSIPRYIKEIYIFDREQTEIYLTSIKGCNIKYYTLFKGHFINEYQRNQVKRDLKKALGGRLKLFYTLNPRIIHERKIIYDDIIITIDNSRNNLKLSEKTWDIFINYDIEKVRKWKEKITKFREVNG